MIFVILGGGFGAITRYALGNLISRKNNTPLPLGTFLINVSGSFLLGMINRLFLSHSINQSLWLLFGVGFLGAYTTFSTFGYETINLLIQKKIMTAVIYVLLSAAFGILFAEVGFHLPI
ncbi:fluoride efflux transporter CrcB [Bacillus sp. RG28]|uniref:Fluoride-specific ion channel FluC n=1 Tax=Gottfriedia endophytica TaxID=2820819 RepID=A0A940NRV9_9BACI|nr:fluoride efflux transporter CrcB [Gottfriedia endophytica]MBP0723763.1 fluoride efflux transporter CrcB [Gottfriedia endophytica]